MKHVLSHGRCFLYQMDILVSFASRPRPPQVSTSYEPSRGMFFHRGS